MESILFLGMSLFINYHAGKFALSHMSNYVTDIILDNVPVYNVDLIFGFGAIVMWIFVGILLVLDPKKLPFVIKAVALLTAIRSLFIMMTHLGPYPERSFLSTNNIVQKFTFGADYFFSGHTAFPYLFALIFWEKPWLRILFVCSSIVFAASVLLGHLHYSIDVFAAFFITYSIYHIAQKIFSRDFQLFNSKE